MKATTIDPSRFNNPHEVPLSVEWMTREEWESRYPDHFVAIVDPECDEETAEDITGGYVVYNSPERENAAAELLRLMPKCFAIRYTKRNDKLGYLINLWASDQPGLHGSEFAEVTK